MKPKNRILALLGSTVVLNCSTAQAANILMNGNDGFNQSSFNTGLRWTGAAAPSAGNAYFTDAYLLRTPSTAGTYTFAGDSLSLDARSAESFLLKSNGSNITINDLRLNGGIMAPGDNGSFTVNGNITTNAVTAISLGLKDGSRSIVLNSNVSGSNPILVGSLGTVGAANSGSLTLGGNNSGFSGGWTLGGSYTNAIGTLYNVSPTNATLKLNHASALGTGNLAINGGTLDLNGFSPTVANFSGSGGTVLASTGSSVLTLGSNNASGGNFAGNVTNGAGQVAVTKIGTGSLTLSGAANNYSGETTVNAGTLSVPASQSGGGNITIADAATFGVNVASNGDTLVTDTLLAGNTTGTTLILNTAATGNPALAPLSASTLTLNAPTTIRLAGTALTVGTGIPLVSYSTVGGTSGLAGLTLLLPARTLGNLDTSTAGLIKANITAIEQIKWVGNVSGAWDIDPTGTGSSGTANWKTTVSNTATRYFQGSGGTDSVNFDDSATGSTAITINGSDVSPAGLVFNNSSKNYTFSGSKGITGSTDLDKSGTGTVALNTSNSFSGGIIINNGSLALGAANTISGVILVNAGTLALNHAGAMGPATLTLEDSA
jgi:autotransporter-associated beta strand protein